MVILCARRNDGYHNIINTDYSPVIIENIKNKCQYTCSDMTWKVMDILNMTYEPETVMKIQNIQWQEEKGQQTLQW
jgi:hypothetical protein